jgi:hypothetical protein
MKSMAYWGVGAVACALVAWSGCGGDETVFTSGTAGAGTGASGGSAGGPGTGGGGTGGDPTGTGGNGGTGGEPTGTGGSGGGSGGGSCAVDPMPPGEPNCPTECTGGCTNQNVCVIDCGAGMCNDGTIDCPPEWACEIHCNGVDACDSSTVNCPPAYACSLTCEGGNDACGDVIFNCTEGSCSVQCGDDVCSGMNVSCGGGACSADCQGQPPPTLECGSACSCTPC